MKTTVFEQLVILANGNADELLSTYMSCFKGLEGGVKNPDYQEGLAGDWYFDPHWDGELVRIIRQLANRGYQVGVPGGTWSALRKGKLQIKALTSKKMKCDFIYVVLEEAEVENLIIKKIETGRYTFLWLDMNKIRRLSVTAEKLKSPK